MANNKNRPAILDIVDKAWGTATQTKQDAYAAERGRTHRGSKPGKSSQRLTGKGVPAPGYSAGGGRGGRKKIVAPLPPRRKP